MRINLLKFLFIKRCVTLHIFMIFPKPSLWLSKQIRLVFFTFSCSSVSVYLLTQTLVGCLKWNFRLLEKSSGGNNH